MRQVFIFLCLLWALPALAQPELNENNISFGLGIEQLPWLMPKQDKPHSIEDYSFNISQRTHFGNNQIRFSLSLQLLPQVPGKYYIFGMSGGKTFLKPLIKPKLFFYYGGDIVLQNYLTYVPNYNRMERRFGVAPLAGLHFQVFKWLSVNTEFGYAFSFQHVTYLSFDSNSSLPRNHSDFLMRPYRLPGIGINFHF